jgi:homoserine dehydrogenase
VKHVTLVQLGIGTVGGALLEQVLENRDRWRRDLGVAIVVGAVGGRSGTFVAEGDAGLSEAVLRDAVEARRAGRGLDQTVADALVPPGEAIARFAANGPTIVFDAAAGETTAALDARALASGAAVVLSNKAPLALPRANPLTAELWAEAGPHGRLRYEATCGAGLPVVSTLRSLLDTGDEVLEIQGALSGTLGAIFAAVAGGQPFSAAVRDAKARGYTEPDPRDDLSGLDVARKALILARTIGRRVDLAEIAVESLVPKHLEGVAVDEFLDRVADLDADLAGRAAAAHAAGQTLKYVATVPADGPIAVNVRAVPTGGILGALQGPENVIAIRTRRYEANPLTVVGPGAGPQVTAAGMLADALALAAGPLAGLGRID